MVESFIIWQALFKFKFYILNIQSRVNNYTTFDSNRDNIKFNQNITNLSDNNKTKQELITAAKISNDPIGRNYKNILVECMNKLY